MAERSRFQLSLSPMGAAALRILKDSEIPLCGFDVVSASGGTIVKGSVWVVLQKLESQMLVVSEKETDENAVIPKRLYRVTGHGISLLEIYERLEKLATTAKWFAVFLRFFHRMYENLRFPSLIFTFLAMRNHEFIDMTQVMGRILFFTILLSVSSACLFFGFLISFDPYHGRLALGIPLLTIWIALLLVLAIGLMRLGKSHVRSKFVISPQAGEIAIVTERAWTLIPFLWLPINVHSVGFLDGESFHSGRTFYFHFRAVRFARDIAMKFENVFSEPKPRRIDDFSMALHMAIFSGIWIFLAYAAFSS